MKNKINSIFPTLIAQGSLPKSEALNRRMMKDILIISKEDKMGRQWSKESYRGGYTSYGSLSDLHSRYPSFAAFELALQPHAEAFAKAQGWNLKGLELRMTQLWVNVMPANVYHTLHFHPHSALSGGYYVQTPPNSIPMKIEDPRMALYMNAPLRENTTAASKDLYYKVPAKAGEFVIFESWLRHEVPPNTSKKSRVSLSFNYSLDNEE